MAVGNYLLVELLDGFARALRCLDVGLTNVEVIQTIYNLTKVKGFTLQGAKDELARNFENAKAQARAVAALERIRARLIDIRQELD